MNNNGLELTIKTSIAIRVVATIIMIAGFIILMGWILHPIFETNLNEQMIVMTPNAALCFILSGVIIWIYTEKKQNQFLYFLAMLLSASIFLFGFLTLFEYFFNKDFYIDQFITSNAIYSAFLAGRMPPLTAVNFVLVGCGLFFIDNKIVTYRVRQVLIILMMIISLFEILAHIYTLGHADVFGIPERYSQMTFVSSSLFLVLGLTILFIRPYQGVFSIFMSQNIGGSLARRLIPPGVLLPIAVGYLVGLAGTQVGFFGAEMGLSLLVLTTIILFIGVILLNAYLVDKVDIERKKNERALNINQVQLQSVLDQTSTIIYLQDLEGKFILINKQFEKFFHKRSAEVVGRKSNEVFPTQFAKKLEENNLKVITKKTPIFVEEIVPNTDAYFMANKFPLFKGDGTLVAVGSITTDISEIKKAQENLRLGKDNFHLALKSAEAGTWSWDIVNNKVVWDDYMCRLFGIELANAPRYFEAVLNLIYEDDRKQFLEKMDQILNDETDFSAEFRIKKIDESVHVLVTKGKIYRDEMGKPLSMIAVCLEITHQKQIEEELHITKEIADTLANKADELSRSKIAFLSAISNEIRIPLNGAIEMTSLLLDSNTSLTQREYIDTLKLCNESLLYAVNDIFDFTKIESGHLELVKNDFDLASVIYDVVEMVVAQVHKKGVTINASIDPAVPALLSGDESRIRQVLASFLNNTAKLTDKGEITVKSTLLNKHKNLNKHNKKVRLLFEVTNTEIGITHDMMARLFQPFSERDISDPERIRETNLGLIIAKRLVEVMGGTIGIESFPDKGSRFWFTLQVSQAHGSVIAVEQKLIPQLLGKRVLCVDDNSINCEMIKRQLDSLQMNCDIVNNGAEALAMLKLAVSMNNPYSLALIDHIMPGMTGLELIEMIRQFNKLSSMPIILLSSALSEDDRKKLGILKVISKPVNRVNLFQSIADVL